MLSAFPWILLYVSSVSLIVQQEKYSEGSGRWIFRQPDGRVEKLKIKRIQINAINNLTGKILGMPIDVLNKTWIKKNPHKKSIHSDTFQIYFFNTCIKFAYLVRQRSLRLMIILQYLLRENKQ